MLKADLTALLKVGHDRGNELRGVLVGASALQLVQLARNRRRMV